MLEQGGKRLAVRAVIVGDQDGGHLEWTMFAQGRARSCPRTANYFVAETLKRLSRADDSSAGMAGTRVATVMYATQTSRRNVPDSRADRGGPAERAHAQFELVDGGVRRHDRRQVPRAQTAKSCSTGRAALLQVRAPKHALPPSILAALKFSPVAECATRIECAHGSARVSAALRTSIRSTSRSTRTAPAGGCTSSAPRSACSRSLHAFATLDFWWLLAGPRRRLRVRLGRALLLREEPPGDLHPPALQLHRRLGDVEGHAHGEDPLLKHAQPVALGLAPRLARADRARALPACCCTRGRTSAAPTSTRCGCSSSASPARPRPWRSSALGFRGRRGHGAHRLPHRRRDRAHPPVRLRRRFACCCRSPASGPPRIVEDLTIVAAYVGLRPGAAARRRRRPRQHRHHLGDPHRGGRLRHAGHARQHARRARDPARQLGAGGRLDQGRRRARRPGARHPLALDADRDAQLGNGGHPQQHADEGPRRRSSAGARARRCTGAAAIELHGRPRRAAGARHRHRRRRDARAGDPERRAHPGAELRAARLRARQPALPACATSSPTSSRTTSPTRWCGCTCSPRCSAPASASPSRSARCTRCSATRRMPRRCASAS